MTIVISNRPIQFVYA